VRRRQLGQANVAHIAVVRVGPFQEVDDGRAADVLVSFVHLHQKLNIQGCVLACEGRCRGLVVLDERDLGQAVGVPLFDQSGDLGAAVAAGVLQVTQQHATVMPAAPGVVKALAAQALKLAAAALRTSQSALGAYFRRMCARMDKAKAVAAAAHKLARLIYTMLTKGEEYTDKGQDYYEERYRQRVLSQLTQRAKKMGMKLVAVESTQPA
jgi:hypothetical protein